MSTVVMDADRPAARSEQLAEINQKLDLLAQSIGVLGAQVNYLMERAEAERRRQQMWDDLFADLKPVLNDMYAATEEQLSEMQQFVTLDDILELVKRLARNTRTLNEMLDLLESAHDFVKDASPLTKEMVTEATDRLAELERKGYFGFARQSFYVIDQIVTSFSEEDVKQLGDNIVLILNTVKALTQPQMMTLLNNLTQGFHEAEAEARAGKLDIGYLALLRKMRDPEVRRGLAITLETLRRVSAQSPKG
ncbi:DUF1641 domain-containing protein [Caldilinea sp.]|uniref:DUF1641 domain-containing protein n=1 Tax=Caldilinea sp. TaxID=2293560 RepID=UPI0021DB9F35|nr:DUF1641 domain-containing protein [Caldilinea sp.]GIV67203.1 MAG: hypothetical protein KatS3mg048_0065 [Caldilinea sp.]